MLIQGRRGYNLFFYTLYASLLHVKQQPSEGKKY